MTCNFLLIAVNEIGRKINKSQIFFLAKKIVQYKVIERIYDGKKKIQAQETEVKTSCVYVWKEKVMTA